MLRLWAYRMYELSTELTKRKGENIRREYDMAFGVLSGLKMPIYLR